MVSLMQKLQEGLWERRNRALVLAISAAIALVIALVDWRTKPYVSLGFLYLFPIMLAAGFLPRWAIVLCGVAGTILNEAYSSLDPRDAPIRMFFVGVAFTGGGLYIAELVRNRRATLEAQARLRALVETSPAAILTIDDAGVIELNNQAAIDLLAPADGRLIGNPISAFVPDLYHALRREEGAQFRAAMRCHGHRGTGEVFPAEVWFSTYREGSAPKLAAILADISDETNPAEPEETKPAARLKELTAREQSVLRLVFQGLANKEIAARLTISESSVKNTLQQLFAKAEVRSRSQLVRVALEHYRDVL
jgi:PAS domain S-box-containing protein